MNNVGGHSPPYGALDTTLRIVVGWYVPTIIVVSLVKKNKVVIRSKVDVGKTINHCALG